MTMATLADLENAIDVSPESSLRCRAISVGSQGRGEGI